MEPEKLIADRRLAILKTVTLNKESAKQQTNKRQVNPTTQKQCAQLEVTRDTQQNTVDSAGKTQ